jgi:hypothetical protein
MARENVCSLQRYLGPKRRARTLEELVEHPWHGEDRGPRVDLDAAERAECNGAGLAPRVVCALQHLHPEPAPREVDGACQSPNARADDDDVRVVVRHGGQS